MRLTVDEPAGPAPSTGIRAVRWRITEEQPSDFIGDERLAHAARTAQKGGMMELPRDPSSSEGGDRLILAPYIT